MPLPGSTGALWLCGKHAVGPDPEAALARVGADAIVCLTERHELEDRYPTYVDWLRRHNGQRAVWHPIPDLHAPELAAVCPLLDDLSTQLGKGTRMLLHCGAGIGRAGTVATCLLMLQGMSQSDALAHVAASRPSAGPEVGPQRDLVAALAATLR